mmetsp:Transcript_13746/g.26215  ORF Transcript_13746/g.26215 Transcript_13746/m.26215 type:complete len:257 (-) Transcript_13746:293-1063(-)
MYRTPCCTRAATCCCSLILSEVTVSGGFGVLLSLLGPFQTRVAIRTLKCERGHVNELLLRTRLPGDLDRLCQGLRVRRAELTRACPVTRPRDHIIVDAVVHQIHAHFVALPLGIDVRLERHDIHSCNLHLVVLTEHGELNAPAPFRWVHDLLGILVRRFAKEGFRVPGGYHQRRAHLAQRRGVAHGGRGLARVPHRREEATVVVGDGHPFHHQPLRLPVGGHRSWRAGRRAGLGSAAAAAAAAAPAAPRGWLALCL